MRFPALAFFCCVATAAAQSPQLIEQAFGSASGAEHPLQSSLSPGVSLMMAGAELQINGGELVSPTTGVRLSRQHERRGSIDLYKFRHSPGSPIRGEQVRLQFSFPAEFNDSMTLDTGALQGQPLYLPDGKVPDNQFTNWGSLFYNSKTNVVVGTSLRGGEMARNARRGHSKFTGVTTLQLTTTTGHPDFEITFFGYKPANDRFWWAEWYQLQTQSLPSNMFPIFATDDPSWAPREEHAFWYIPGPTEPGRKMDLVLIDDIRQTLTARVPFTVSLPVTKVAVSVGNWKSGLYRLIAVPAEKAVDAKVNNLNEKLTTVMVRPERPSSPALYVAPTDMWWAYSTNGGHDYHGWRTGYDGSVGYSPTVMSSRHHRYNHFFYSLYERFRDIHHLRYIDSLGKTDNIQFDYATQYDVARGRVKLGDYKLVQIGNHSEFTTVESHRRFQEYLGAGGNVMIHGGDSFAVIVEYLPSLENPRYIWQRGHVWTHLSDQPSDFKAPIFLPSDAAPNAPIVAPTAGKAVDYMNAFHTTVGSWIPGSKAVVANTKHPILKDLGLQLGQEVPGPWGSEVDFAYEPQAWDILVRSDRAAPEDREFGIDAYDPTPLHRIAIAAHKNLGLMMVCGENYPNIMANPGSTLFRDIYRRSVRYLMDRGGNWRSRPDQVPTSERDKMLIVLPEPAEIQAVQYELPQFVNFEKQGWHLKAAPYAHYRVEASLDGQTWTTIADRLHGPWRGAQTDLFAPVKVRYLRFDGQFSNGEPFAVRNVSAR